MNINKEQAISEHRKMWNWIADETEERQQGMTEYEYADEVDATVRLLYDHSWICEYANQEAEKNESNDICKFCPLEWGENVAGENRCVDYLEGLYAKWSSYSCSSCRYDWEMATILARQIAELPVKETKKK